MKWDDVKKTYANRVGEPEMFELGQVEQEWNSPFTDPEAAEALLYEAAVDELLATSDMDLNSLGSAATEEATLSDNADVPTGLIEIIGAAIRQGASGDYLPATMLSPAKWYEMLSVSSDISSNYALIGGKVRVKGDSLKLQYKVLPTKSQLRSDSAILPDGCEEAIVERARKIALIEDFMPRAEY